MGEARYEVVQEFADLGQRPKVLPAHAEGLCAIIVLRMVPVSPLQPALLGNLCPLYIPGSLNGLIQEAEAVLDNAPSCHRKTYMQKHRQSASSAKS